jgi:hypothetical protein
VVFRVQRLATKLPLTKGVASLSSEREPVGKMIATILRDMGLLVLVFMPLDASFANAPVPGVTFWEGIGSGVLLITLGIVLERKRS